MPLKRVIDFENVAKVLSSLSSEPRETQQELVMSVVRMKVPFLLYKTRATASRKSTVMSWNNPVNKAMMVSRNSKNQSTATRKPTVMSWNNPMNKAMMVSRNSKNQLTATRKPSVMSWNPVNKAMMVSRKSKNRTTAMSCNPMNMATVCCRNSKNRATARRKPIVISSMKKMLQQRSTKMKM